METDNRMGRETGVKIKENILGRGNRMGREDEEKIKENIGERH